MRITPYAVYALAALFAGVLGALIGLAIATGWPTAEGDRWLAVTGLATSVVAVASLIGLGALGFLAQQGISLRRQARVRFGPYLRIDLAPDSVDGTWKPPDVDDAYRFDWDDFNPGQSEPRTPLTGWLREDGTDLCIWLENRQSAPGGTAHNIEIVTEITCVRPGDGTVDSFLFRLRVHYLEPGRRIRYRIATLDPAIPYLRGEIREMVYADLYGNRLAFGHGAAAFEWDGDRLNNMRAAFRSEQ